MARAMREVRWAVTPLGAVESWPPTLRSSVALLLRSQFPMFLAWGPELRLFYNDAYAQILGTSTRPRSARRSRRPGATSGR